MIKNRKIVAKNGTYRPRLRINGCNKRRTVVVMVAVVVVLFHIVVVAVIG